MSLLESELMRRFMEGNLGKRSETHNDHAASIDIFFAAFQTASLREDRTGEQPTATAPTRAMSRFPKQGWEIVHLGC
jgi:hypothetical protein